MQLTDTFCYVLITISIAATCIDAEYQIQDTKEKKIGKRISKREASIIVDNFPLESMFNQKQKIIYKRISKHRSRNTKSKHRLPTSSHGPSSPKYGPPKLNYRSTTPKRSRSPPRSKYGPTTPRRNIHKKPSNKNKQNAKKHIPKPKYGPPPKTKRNKLKYSGSKKLNHFSYHPREPAGFGEPPLGVEEYNQLKYSNGEPPVDSYGAPLKLTERPDGYDTSNHFASTDYNNFGLNLPPWAPAESSKPTVDNTFAYSERQPLIIEPNANVFDVQPGDSSEVLNSYSDVFSYSRAREPNFERQPQKRPGYIIEHTKTLNKPWKPTAVTEGKVVVGGQYAEPPARYVPKFQPSAPMNVDDNEFNPYIDSDVAASATASPYVNYKNSNMAFSPQNLNDVFSIVDKK